jgi:hypothetical protein
MNELDSIIAQQYIVTTILRIEAGLIDIRKNNPHREDLIVPMEQSIAELKQSLLNQRFLDRQIGTYKHLNNNLTEINLTLIDENRRLKKELDEIKVNEKYISELEEENKELNSKLKILLDEI